MFYGAFHRSCENWWTAYGKSSRPCILNVWGHTLLQLALDTERRQQMSHSVLTGQLLQGWKMAGICRNACVILCHVGCGLPFSLAIRPCRQNCARSGSIPWSRDTQKAHLRRRHGETKKRRKSSMAHEFGSGLRYLTFIGLKKMKILEWFLDMSSLYKPSFLSRMACSEKFHRGFSNYRVFFNNR